MKKITRKENHRRRTARAAAVFLCCALLSGCGQKTAEWEAPSEEEEVSSEAASEEMETEQTEYVTESVVETTTEEDMADYSWIEPYRAFLSDHNNLLPLLQEQNEGGARGFITGFFLYDVDHNGIPELLVQKYLTADYIYTCVDGEVKLRNVMMYDSFAESLLTYDVRGGKMYNFTLDSGTGTDRVMDLSEISLLEEEWMMEMGFDAGQESIYSAVYGGLEQSDGNYLQVEWTDAVPNEGNAVSKEEFEDITNHLVPIVPRAINEENLTKYLQEDYLETDMYESCSLWDYQEQMAEREAAFSEDVPEIEAGGDGMQENIVLMEDGNSFTIYCDLERLACYQEAEVKLAFDEEWKNIYRDWLMNIDQQTDINGEPVMESDDYKYVEGVAYFSFEEWDYLDAPLLCISGGKASMNTQYFWIDNGQVKPLYSSSEASAEYTFFLDGTNYMLSIYNSYMGIANLFQMVDGEMVLIATATIQSEFGGIEVSEEKYEVAAQPVSREEFIMHIDSFLGAGAGNVVLSMAYNIDAVYENGTAPLVLDWGSGEMPYELNQINEGLEAYGNEG